ncbi:MAG TPA: hypothetical protein VMO00_19015 [Methylomirabilota bacterium]|nr:hypothetical protein [Methylomirabilota bacterium]
MISCDYFKWLIAALVSTVWLPLASLTAQQTASSPPLVIVGGTLIDATGKPPLEDAAIVIDGERVMYLRQSRRLDL